MPDNKNIFVKKKILIYGLGKSGFSTYLFLRKNNDIYLYDDNKNIIKNKKIKKLLIKSNYINKINFDFVVVSPGINIKKCYLKSFLKKNFKKIVTDLDVFYNHYSKNKNITITGTNGKSTTAKILFDVLKNQKRDVRLTGNIGNPILTEKKITSKTIFVIEASSYQIEYSKNFKANYAVILNITPDHLERHGTFANYIKAKFKLIRTQTNKDYSFLNKNNKFLKKEINKEKLNSKIINVNIKSMNQNLLKIKNTYFLTEGNKQNLLHVFAVAKKLGVNKNILFKTVDNFKGLKFRQQIIYESKKFTLINDSKATSYSSSINILKSLKKVYWIVGGIPKLGDKFLMSKNQCSNFKAYIFGINKNSFIKELKNKINYEHFDDLKQTLKKIILDIKLKKKEKEHKTILFSPSAASFDSFKNFEDRGEKFNKLIKKLNLKKIINAR
jgi:UDP-N-acetylmuramoylalanine--D-glutamate ligase